MKKLLILIAVFMFGTFSMVSAQDLAGMFNISPFGGLGMPMGDLADDDPENDDGLFRKMGFKFGAAAEYFFTPNIGAGLDFLYAIHGAKEIEGEEFDDKLHTMNIGVHGKYVFMTEGMLRPYGILGVGMTMNKLKDLEEGDETFEAKIGSKLYIMGGIGAMYFVSDMISIFGELGFDYMMLDGASIEVDGEETDDEVEANYYFLDLKVGLNVWFGGTE